MFDTVYSFSLEATDRNNVCRGFVWKTGGNTGPRPVTVLYDVAEGDLATINLWLQDFYPNVSKVRLADGTLDEPDCLTVFEAAEAALA